MWPYLEMRFSALKILKVRSHGIGLWVPWLVSSWADRAHGDAERSTLCAGKQRGWMSQQAEEYQGLPATVKRWKRQRGFFQKLSEGRCPCLPFNFKLLASRLWENTVLSFPAAKFLVLCCRSSRKLIREHWDLKEVAMAKAGGI